MFTWDPKKAALNLRKHGLSFEEAAAAFMDPAAVDGPDLKHWTPEERRLLIGKLPSGRVITVSYMWRTTNEGAVRRLISARQASRKERQAYARTR